MNIHHAQWGAFCGVAALRDLPLLPSDMLSSYLEIQNSMDLGQRGFHWTRSEWKKEHVQSCYATFHTLQSQFLLPSPHASGREHRGKSINCLNASPHAMCALQSNSIGSFGSFDLHLCHGWAEDYSNCEWGFQKHLVNSAPNEVSLGCITNAFQISLYPQLCVLLSEM